MQARVDWVLIIFTTQVIKKKRPVRPVFPDYISLLLEHGTPSIFGGYILEIFRGRFFFFFLSNQYKLVTPSIFESQYVVSF